MAHPLLGFAFVIVLMGLILGADTIESPGNQEAFDGNISRLLNTIDVNVANSVAQHINSMNLDSDTNAYVQEYVKPVISASKANFLLGASFGKNNSWFVHTFSIPIVIFMLLFMLGFPTITIFFACFVFIYDKFKGKKFSEPNMKQDYLK